MNPPSTKAATFCLSMFAGALLPASAGLMTTDSFGSGGNQFGIDFVSVGNAGNGNDAGGGGGSYSAPYGAVGYNFRMAVTEVPQDWITKATALGMTNVTAGSWAGTRPAASMNWYEAAGFVNWLNTSTGHQAAYNLTFSGGWTMSLWSAGDAWDNDPGAGTNLNAYRHKNARYFLPSENEWYKSAYHQNDGATANYFDFATGSNVAPVAVAGGTATGTAVYGQPGYALSGAPVAVGDAGGLSAYGTRGQNGNVWEWMEGAADGVNNSTTENRVSRGGNFFNTSTQLRPDQGRIGVLGPTSTNNDTGFRIASIEPVPEPGSAATGIALLGIGLARRRRAR